MLIGTEVKSLREGRASLVDGFATIERRRGVAAGRAHRRVRAGHLDQPRAAPHAQAAAAPAEIERLVGTTKESGLTLVPLPLYFTGSQVKVELALARGKQSYDKRQDLAKRDAQREIARAMGRRVEGHRLSACCARRPAAVRMRP